MPTASPAERQFTDLSKKGIPEYDTLLHSVERLHFWSSGECEDTFSLPLLFDPLRHQMEVLVKVPSGS